MFDDMLDDRLGEMCNGIEQDDEDVYQGLK